MNDQKRPGGDTVDDGFERQAEWLANAREMTPTLEELLPQPVEARQRWREAVGLYQDDLQRLMDALDDVLMDE